MKTFPVLCFGFVSNAGYGSKKSIAMDDSFQGPYEIAGSKGFQNEPVRVGVAHRFQKALTSMHGKK
ncbi:MAG TPA: hypothetical protein VHW45_12845 [Candidatus Sulfotelmatobacter sp.]|jgi:hypothetical protein|nr:hypothetical protein [Candidatus Sulfotelmatobacter sp.]